MAANFLPTQSKFFDKILENRPKKDVVRDITESLGITKDKVYRLLRGHTPIKFEELVPLANKYDISVDDLIFDYQSNTVPFLQHLFPFEWSNMDSFSIDIAKRLGILSPKKRTELYYSTNELPSLYQVMSPNLMKFQFYAWIQLSDKYHALKHESFALDKFPSSFIKSCELFAMLYMANDSTEFWKASMFDNMFTQIEWLLHNNRFANPADALVLWDELYKFTLHARQMAKAGKKYFPNSTPTENNKPFKVYHNIFGQQSDTILIKTVSEQDKLSNSMVIQLNMPRFMTTSNENYCNEEAARFEKLKKQAVVITDFTNPLSQAFFDMLEQKLHVAKKRFLQLAER